MVDKWISGAIKHEGTLSKQLGIPIEDNIPITLLDAIIRAPIGTIIDNPTDEGHKRFKVTRLLKQRSVLAKNLKNIGK